MEQKPTLHHNSRSIFMAISMHPIHVLCPPCFRVCSLLPCGHLLGKGWPLGSRSWCLMSFLSLSHVVSWVRCDILECIDSFFLSFSTTLTSLKLEHYAWGANFDKIKKTKTTTKHKNFWLNFCWNKECPKLLCGLDIGHRRRQTIPIPDLCHLLYFEE